MRILLTILTLLITEPLFTSCSSEPQHVCQKTTREFIKRFNGQDFRGIVSLFQPRALQKAQINRLVNNLTYVYSTAGTIQGMRLSTQEGSSMSYISIHEHTAMDLVFQVDDQCNLISYKIDTHYPDSLPILERNETPLSLPFHGEWYVKWGGTDVAQNYHNAYRNMKGAIDFTIRDQVGKAFRTDGKSNQDFYAFGQPVIASCDAKVINVISGIEDNPIGRPKATDTYGNAVVLRTQRNEYLLLAHLQSESIKVEPGQMVHQGDTIARCGNSGYSTVPHLHFIVQNVANLFHPTGATSYFDHIEVNGIVKQDYSPVQGERVRNIHP